MEREGHRMMARDNKQIDELLPWLLPAQRKKALENLRDKNFLFILDATLMVRDTTRWYGINYNALKKLESITILGDGDFEDLRDQGPVAKQKAIKVGIPQLHKDLMPCVIKMSNLTTPLTPRDAKEAQDFIKKITTKYSEEDFGRLQRRILGMRVWQESRRKGDEKFLAPRPLTAWSNWERYGQYCREQCNGNLPPIPAEWIAETNRK